MLTGSVPGGLTSAPRHSLGAGPWRVCRPRNGHTMARATRAARVPASGSIAASACVAPFWSPFARPFSAWGGGGASACGARRPLHCLKKRKEHNRRE